MRIGFMVFIGVFCALLTLMTLLFTLMIAGTVIHDIRKRYTDVGSGIVGILVCSLSFVFMLLVDWAWTSWAWAPITAYLA